MRGRCQRAVLCRRGATPFFAREAAFATTSLTFLFGLFQIGDQLFTLLLGLLNSIPQYFHLRGRIFAIISLKLGFLAVELFIKIIDILQPFSLSFDYSSRYSLSRRVSVVLSRASVWAVGSVFASLSSRYFRASSSCTLSTLDFTSLRYQSGFVQLLSGFESLEMSVISIHLLLLRLDFSPCFCIYRSAFNCLRWDSTSPSILAPVLM